MNKNNMIFNWSRLFLIIILNFTFISILLVILGKIINDNIYLLIIGGSLFLLSLITLFVYYTIMNIKYLNKKTFPKIQENIVKPQNIHYPNDIYTTYKNDKRYYKNLKKEDVNFDLNQIKLIITDLDGTLLDHNSQITFKTREIFTKFYKKLPHILIVPASGRDFYGMHKLLKDLLKTEYMICTNGSVLYDFNSGKILNFVEINYIFITKIFDYTLRNSFHSIVYSDLGETIIHNKCIAENNWFSSWIKQYKLSTKTIDINSHVFQCGVWIPNSKFKFFKKYMVKRFCLEYYTYNHPDFTYLEITAPGVNKWTMIDKICSIKNIKPDEVLTIGNGNNDVEMINKSSLGVAVANSEQVLIDSANLIIDPNHIDGVATFLEEWFLLDN